VNRLEAIDLIYEDLFVPKRNRPYQPDVKKTVVVMSFNLGTDANTAVDATAAIKPILELGVPVVVSSGNKRKTVDHSDKIPAVLYAPDFPLIVIGGTDINGNRDTFSQGGPKVAVHAPGSNIDVSQKHGTKATGKGTSFGKFEIIRENPHGDIKRY
jgi:copper homeostasis protein CutC